MATGSITAWIASNAAARITIHEIRCNRRQHGEEQQQQHKQHARGEDCLIYFLFCHFSNHAKKSEKRRTSNKIKCVMKKAVPNSKQKQKTSVINNVWIFDLTFTYT